MAIRFFNIRSGEEAVAETEPHISAMWASSDHSPNITQGQDFGWRMAPEVIVEMKEIKQDPIKLQEIAVRLNKPFEDVNEPDILTYISSKTAAQAAPVASGDDYQDMYDQEVRRLTEAQLKAKKAAMPKIESTDTKESLADLERRVELEERLARAKAINNGDIDEDTTRKSTADLFPDTTQSPPDNLNATTISKIVEPKVTSSKK